MAWIPGCFLKKIEIDEVEFLLGKAVYYIF